MSFSLTSLDVYYLVREVRPLLQDAFVDKVYQGKDEKGDFLIRMRSPKTGKQQLFIRVPDALFLTDHRYPWPQYPPGFCMQLRKHLTNAKLVGFEQHSFERIVELTFMKGEVVWRLVVELFSKGNVVLVNSDGLIRGVMDVQRWKDRSLRVNAQYQYPPPVLDTPRLSLEELRSAFSSSGKELVRFCATVLGLGGKYAEELVARSGLDKHATTLSDDEFSLLHRSLQGLFAEQLSPVVCGGDAAPFMLVSWSGKDCSRVDSFSRAVEGLVVSEKIAAVEESSEQVITRVADKYQRIIEEQEKLLAAYERSARENQRKGEYVYEHYQELKELLDTLKDLHEKGGWRAVKSFIAEKQLPVTVNEREGTVTLEVNDN